MVTEQVHGAFLGLAQQADGLLVDDALGLLGVGPPQRVLGALAAEVVGAPEPYPMGPRAGDRPNSRTMRAAIWVAPARSSKAPVEPSPKTTSRAARPPSRTVSRSVR
ncbi:hypothetical protein OG819_41280 [Streptomyces sp. NBC_01549]|uniref:hypothetical protein n=1 Tax=Streptomyces sp. NBC_01549 TaxID=2975874 RepID=UPI0022524378|nr:hypothetical protein [Streptomyces sp. NBC_01549]MCX4595864.1 hypothetical protein [Streptomyces sp. NBC_01549]